MVSFAIAVPHAAPALSPAASAQGWANAAAVPLQWNVVGHKTGSEPTTARIATDGTSIYVRFDAVQHEPITAQQHSDNVGQGSDDAVWIDLWPGGSTGYQYQFESTPNGTHYQSSSENSGYAPKWQSFGAVHDGGYTVTMRIPLTALRGSADATWKVQFVRAIHATGEQLVWSFDSSQMSPDDVARAGTLQMPAGAERPQPRIALYGLAKAASSAIGGSTSRTGADISVPITSTASFYATLHPDFSNVELDQQSISPSVYQRFFSEVRPFFTQGASFYGNVKYYVTSAPIEALYTPAIPTPREGYAVEGKAGALSAAAFDALGADRSDAASVMDYDSADARWHATVQHVGVHTKDIADVTSVASARYSDLKHLTLYAVYGGDSGNAVRDGGNAQWYDAGGGWQNKTFGFYAAMRKVGEFFNPADGYVFHPGIAGYALYSSKIFDFSAASKILSMGISGSIYRYQGAVSGTAQSDSQVLVDVLTKSALDFQLSSGSDYFRFGSLLEPVSQNAGFSLTYHSGLQTNNPGPFPYHGSSATPTSIAYSTGRYGSGRLDTWQRTSTIRVGSRGFVGLTLDDTAQWMSGRSNIQWFESASYTEQSSESSSWSVGLRKIVGQAPEPNGGGNCAGTCTNISMAYYYRMAHSELYLSYGDPNALLTTPQAIVKLIFYAGADKGT